MVSEAIKNLDKRHKQSRDLKIGEKVFTPCLKECSLYRRGTGTFGSSAFKNYLGAIGDIVSSGTKLEIITSMNGIADDSKLFSAIKGARDEYGRKKILQEYCDKTALIVAGCHSSNNSGEYFQKLIAYLIANNQLEIKFALPLKDGEISSDFFDPESIKQRAMYHFKYGYYLFPDKDHSCIAFEGSVNETDTALFHSGEHVTLFKSWVDGENDDVAMIRKYMDEDWEEKNIDFRFFNISDETIDVIKTYSRKFNGDERPVRPNPEPKPIPNPEPKPIPNPEPIDENYKWRHQDEALKKFLEVKAGILAMATGTGKTRTAIKIATHLFKKGNIDSIIITMNGNPLLKQWKEEINEDTFVGEKVLIENFEQKKGAQNFLNDPANKILLITSDELNILKFYNKEYAERTLIIYDEVHDMGQPMKIVNTEGLHKKIPYRLGLSATPSRGDFDEDGTTFILEEIGDIFYSFDLKKAIERGILVEFNYEALFFQITEEEKKAKQDVWKKLGKEINGKVWDEGFCRIMASKVTKNSESKIDLFDSYLEKNGLEILKRTIVFVDTFDFGEKIIGILKKHKFLNFNNLFSDKSEETQKSLQMLADKHIDCLITCHKLSQGIDIKSLENVIIFASSVTNRETIQRLGRALRYEPANPKKKAKLLDFCVPEEKDAKYKSADTLRYEWLTDLSKTKNKE